jgi:hypothetical protein
MSRSIRYLGVLCLLCLGQHSVAAPPYLGSLGRELQCTRCAVFPCCCPDDYCRKPMPCIPCVRLQGCCDDYCPKPEPCAPRFCTPRCPDDYCPKPLPQLCWPVNKQFYRCPPSPASSQTEASWWRTAFWK